MTNFKKLLVTGVFFLSVSTSLTASANPSSLVKILDEMEEKNLVNLNKVDTTVASPEETEVIKEVRWTLPRATTTERIVLTALQDRGITDKYALATVLGNIKQESNFHANICEGGSRISYNSCRYGGYGLIQWTSTNRYLGLGRHARNLGMNPSSSEAQVSYLFTEQQWKKFEPKLKKPGQSIDYYMNGAYGWLGWGLHGNRTYYSNSYLNRLQESEVVLDDGRS